MTEHADASASRSASLLRVLGVAFGLAIIIGNTIGGGILRVPGQVASNLPTPTLFLGVWVLGGIYALLGAVSVAELGASIPRAGGQYAFAQRAIGPYAGFVVGWSDWLSTCGSATAAGIVIGEYLPAFVPSLEGHTTAIAIAVILLFTFIQWRGVVWGGRTQELTSLVKALAFVALIVACFAGGAPAEPAATPPPPAAPTGFAACAAVVLALQGILYTYDGWTGVIYFSEEVHDPGRDVPRSMIGGVLLVIAIYLLLNAALLTVLPIADIASSKLPAGLAAETIFGARGDTVIRVLAMVSMLSAINAFMMMASRTLFGMSRDGLVHHSAQRVNRGGTPSTALWIGAVVAIAFLFVGAFDQVVAVLAFFFVVSYTVSFSAVFILRRTEPDLPRPYRALGYPWTTGIALVGSVAYLAGSVVSDPVNSRWALAALGLSYPVYRIVRRRDGGGPPSDPAP